MDPFLLAILICVTCVFYNCVWKRRGLPPGPIPLPILGNALDIAKHPPGYEPFFRWQKKYGPMFTIWFGERPCVVFTDFQLIKETYILKGEAFAGRLFLQDLTHHLPSMGDAVGLDGPNWSQFRRFFLANIMKRISLIEAQIMISLQLFIAKITTEKAEGQDNHDIMEKAREFSASVINQVLFSYPLNTEEHLAELNRLKSYMDRFILCLGYPSTRLLLVMPQMRHFPPFSSAFKQLDETMNELYIHIRKQIENKSVNIEEMSSSEEEDLATMFLFEMKKHEQQLKETGEIKENTADENMFTMKNIIQFFTALFSAGIDTTSYTITFLFLYLMRDSRVQKAMHEELSAFIRKRDGDEEDEERPIGIYDRSQLPYTNAVINETQRLLNLLPLNLLHETHSDVIVRGYKIPKKTLVVAQLCTVLHDENVFSEPEKFLPERFFDEDGKCKKFDEQIPFSVGKRACLGEGLARMELFLFTANFFRKFWVLPVDPSNPPSIDKIPGLGVTPHPFTCRIVLVNEVAAETL